VEGESEEEGGMLVPGLRTGEQRGGGDGGAQGSSQVEW
jgi:hypothetical protein